MTKAISFKRKDVARPPDGEPWIFHTLTLLRSQAWRAKSNALARLLEFLEIEHLGHGGFDNGRLHAPYDDLVAFGIRRANINRTIEEGENLRLIKATRRGKDFNTGKRLPTLYELTYLPTCVKTGSGAFEWSAPSNAWQNFRAATCAANSKTWFRRGNLAGTANGTRARAYFEEKGQKPSSTTCHLIPVPQAELPSISREEMAPADADDLASLSVLRGPAAGTA